MDKEQNLSRGSLLAKLAIAPLAIGALAVLRAEEAEAKTAPSAVMYVAKSTNGKYCKGCRFYQGTTTKPGACSIVSGSIAPGGYCVAYAAK